MFQNWFSENEVFLFHLVHTYSPLLSIIHDYSLIHVIGKFLRSILLQLNGAIFVFVLLLLFDLICKHSDDIMIS